LTKTEPGVPLIAPGVDGGPRPTSRLLWDRTTGQRPQICPGGQGVAAGGIAVRGRVQTGPGGEQGASVSREDIVRLCRQRGAPPVLRRQESTAGDQSGQQRVGAGHTQPQAPRDLAHRGQGRCAAERQDLYLALR